MSEGSVTLLNNPYGQVTFDLFRKEDQAFVDKSLVIKYLDDYGTRLSHFKRSQESPVKYLKHAV